MSRRSQAEGGALQIQSEVEEEVDSDVITYDREQEPLLSNPDPTLDKRWNRQRWISIYIMYFTMFLSAITFSIVLSSLWPYLLEVDPLTSTRFLGWVVAAYSFGQLVASPLLGIWADRRPAYEPLICSMIVNIVFNVLYCYAGAFQQKHQVSGWVVLISRTLIGFGAGNAAIVRSYVSEATTEKERNGAMAGVSGFQAIGFIAGPALGLAFVPLGAYGWRIDKMKFIFNMYTGPAYLGAVLGVVNIVLLVFLFKIRKLATSDHSKIKMKKVLTDTMGKSWSVNLSSFSRPRWDPVAAAASVVLFFIILFVFSVFETIGTPLTMDEFAWTKHQAVLYNNICYAGLAVIAIGSFVVVKFITKWVDDRVVFMVAMFIIAFGFFALIPMGSEYPAITMQGVEGPSEMANGSSALVVEKSMKTVGCRYSMQHWCISVPQIYLFQYVISLVLIAVGYPTASVMCYTIYSKILGQTKQGAMMGVLTAAGSLARSLGPIFVSHLYQSTGPEVTFASVDALVAAGIVILLVFSYRLKPFRKS